MRAFWSHFPSKIDEKIDAKIDDEKVMKIDEKSIRKLIYIFIFFEIYVHKKRIFRKRLMCVNHMNPRVTHVSARVRPKITKSENEKNNWINWGKEKNISIISWPDLPEMAIPFLKDKNLKNMLCFPVNHQFDLTKIIS